jgi:hypothetical protein
MANVVSLELFKKHVRADDFADDDTYLEHLLEVAQESVINATNRTEAELTEMGGGSFPVSLKHAIMLLGGHLYNQRESVSQVQLHAVPDSLQALIKPFRKLADDSGTDEV